MRSVTDHTRTWRHGDPVTSRHDETLEGTAVCFTGKQGRPLVKIAITTGPHAGQKMWANHDWLLGHGPHRSTCLECDQPFRTAAPRPDFCLACARHQRPHDDADISLAHARNAAHAAPMYTGPRLPMRESVVPVEAPHDPDCCCETCAKAFTEAVQAAQRSA
jgi:hypothetical protein